MTISTALMRAGLTRTGSRELAFAAFFLVVGVALMPALIFFAGLVALGRYEGASLGNIYRGVFSGLGQASIASWAVLLGPYALYLLYKGLRAWWRAGAVEG